MITVKERLIRCSIGNTCFGLVTRRIPNPHGWVWVTTAPIISWLSRDQTAGDGFRYLLWCRRRRGWDVSWIEYEVEVDDL